MDVKKAKIDFERSFQVIENATQVFYGVDGYDVYNCSQPFEWNGKCYIFGRVERREEWMRSWVRLFEKSGNDEWTLVEDSMIYQLEDPYIAIIKNEIVFGGTHVRVQKNELETFYGYFYRGTNIDDLYYFTTGPDYMKDIRLVELEDGRIGVFSRPRGEDILEKYGSESMVGFTIIDTLDELTAERIEQADYLEGLFKDGEWGGCNQAFLLEDGMIGVLGHISYLDEEQEQSVYANMSFVLDPKTLAIYDYKIIATRASFPAGPSKKDNLKDCAFTSGMSMREDGKADFFSGIGDTQEGRSVIEYPFAEHGRIVQEKDN
ncbi:hypothetical protein IGI37_003316 [Enterococcus sp. AZ194]|uniref:DUF1861 family protein n=1 Tax=Enterococcus sp. AZ194 TaxID=2774629 RepID=UPI003F1E7308